MSRLKKTFENIGLAPKDLLAIGISLAALSVSFSALIVSGANFYFTQLRQIEDLQAIISFDSQIPSGRRHRVERALYVSGTTNLTLVNSGTRPIAVLRMYLLVAQQSGKEWRADNTLCDFEKAGATGLAIFTYDASAFVVKASEIVTNKYSIGGLNFLDSGSASIEPRGDGIFKVPVTSVLEGNSDYTVRYCMAFQVAGPSSSRRTTVVALYDARYKHTRMEPGLPEYDNSEILNFGPVKNGPVKLISTP
jgi:hypothetical protein